jgi:2-polyprenyl-3-methyl-5-hydroxy-6-metoxy-1,4-benzoquinol methylase
MTRHTTSLPPRYFEERYAADPDPWDFATSPYERAKYAATLAALPRPPYDAALEVGCSIGVLTERLAGLCASVLAIDVAEAALDQARRRCASLPHVRFALTQVPGAWPQGHFDLILLSEVIYYLDAADIRRLAERVTSCLRPGGDVVLVHWTGETHYPLSGDAAVEQLIAASLPALSVVRQTRQEAYRLDVLRRPDA